MTTIPKRRYGNANSGSSDSVRLQQRQVSPNADRIVIRDVYQRARVEAMRPQRTMCFALGTVIRAITVRIGKLFERLLDRANERV
jgi:hypothetical protein